MGFNLLFYGYGDKEPILRKFINDVLSQRHYTFLLDGFSPIATLHTLFSSMITTLRLGVRLTMRLEGKADAVC